MKNKLSVDIYKETYEVLKIYPELFKQIPKEIQKYIEKQALKSVRIFEYSSEEEIFSQIDKKSLSLFAYLYIKYGNLNESQKDEIKKILINNEIEAIKKSKVENFADDIMNRIKIDFENDIDSERNQIINEVKLEAEKKVNQYISENELGYEHYLYLEIQKRLAERGIVWSYYDEGIVQ